MRPGTSICEEKNCTQKATGEFVRINKEGKDWPKGMPIALCSKHAKDRTPLTNKEIVKIMKRLFPTLLFCLTFMGCSAQLIETTKTNLPVGYVLVVGPNHTIIALSPDTFKAIPPAPSDIANLLDTAKDFTALIVVNHKLVAFPANFTESAGELQHVIGSASITNCIATRSQYYVSVSGAMNTVPVSALKIYYSYTDSNGTQQVQQFPDITDFGSYNPGLYSINVKVGTTISIYTVADPATDYNIAYSIHQQ